MPEGDNVHRHQDEFRPLLVGVALEKVWLRGLEQPALRGKKVLSVDARGKHLLIGLEGGWTIRVHLGIAGSWKRLPRGQLSPSQTKWSHLTLATESVALVCKAKQAEILRSAFLREHRALAALGPDLCGEAPDLDEVVRRARASSHTTLADLLLDQKVAAGLGNVYKSELLFIHKLSPFVPPSSVDDATLRKVYEEGARLLRANVGPGPRVTRPGGRHWVFGRARSPCFTCGATILVSYEGDSVRRTFYCPRCQEVAQ